MKIKPSNKHCDGCLLDDLPLSPPLAEPHSGSRCSQRVSISITLITVQHVKVGGSYHGPTATVDATKRPQRPILPDTDCVSAAELALARNWLKASTVIRSCVNQAVHMDTLMMYLLFSRDCLCIRHGAADSVWRRMLNVIQSRRPTRKMLCCESMPSPQDVVPILGETGRRKASRHAVHIFFSAVSAGCLLSFAAASAATVTTSSWVCETYAAKATC